MEEGQAKDKLPEIFNILLSAVDSWEAEDKKWFGRNAAQACANTHQIVAKYSTEVPASLRLISSMIDLHTQRKQSDVIDFLEAASILAEREAQSHYGKIQRFAPSTPNHVIEFSSRASSNNL